MLHETHARVAWPALLVVVTDDILVVRIGVLRQVTLDQVARFLRREPAGRTTKALMRKQNGSTSNAH